MTDHLEFTVDRNANPANDEVRAEIAYLRGRARQQDDIGNVIFTGVTTALKTVDANGVAADGLSF